MSAGIAAFASGRVASLPWILRVGVAGCYLGHGAFGVITKAAWVPYFGVAGISPAWAWKLMPVVGWTDIAIGLLALAWPCRFLFGWAVGWAVWTALLRPLSGEPFWETIERAGNFGVPLAILAVAGIGRAWFARLPDAWPALTETVERRLAWTLRLTTAALLFGHGALGFFFHKAALAKHYAALGVSRPADFVPVVGGGELILAALVLAFPRPALLFFVCAWKLASESLFLAAGAPFWEIVERFGSYTAPLALAFLLLARSHKAPPASSGLFSLFRHA